MSFIDPGRPQQDSYARGVNLVQALHEEFATSPQVIRRQIVEGRVTINGNPYDPPKALDKLFVPLELAEGAEIVVIGPVRSWKFTYRR